MNNRLAVLIPAFEGGDLLRRTVESCLNAGLDRSTYSVIVVDNASADGSLNGLDPDVEVHRNPHNVGRTGNWNRALEIAEQAGFTYATFLFVGDEWIKDGSLGQLLRSMEVNGSVLGMAALRIVSEEGTLVREGARVSIRGAAAQVDSSSLLTRAISSGRLPFAPVQCNVYRLYKDRPLRFSARPEDGLNCDLEATVRFLQNHPGVVSIEAEPQLLWKERRGRFFTGQDPWNVFIGTRQTLQRVSDSTGIAVDWKNANAVAMLAALRETSTLIPLRARLSFQLRALIYLLRDTSGLSALRMIAFVLRKVIRGRNYLDLSDEPDLVRRTSTPLQAVAE
ncbi:MAG TPA: glycosyltransferase [Bryobacteraceae bacterium]|nr:glycosyltransferase [Bryobacteraceae bacterium]